MNGIKIVELKPGELEKAVNAAKFLKKELKNFEGIEIIASDSGYTSLYGHQKTHKPVVLVINNGNYYWVHMQKGSELYGNGVPKVACPHCVQHQQSELAGFSPEELL